MFPALLLTKFPESVLQCVLPDSGTAWCFCWGNVLPHWGNLWMEGPTQIKNRTQCLFKLPPIYVGQPFWFAQECSSFSTKSPRTQETLQSQGNWDGWFILLTLSRSGFWLCFSFLVTTVISKTKWQIVRLCWKGVWLLSLVTAVLTWQHFFSALVLWCPGGGSQFFMLNSFNFHFKNMSLDTPNQIEGGYFSSKKWE